MSTLVPRPASRQGDGNHHDRPPPTAPALDPDAVLADLFRSHHGPLVRAATLLLRDVGVAEEIVQDAYVKLHGALPRLRQPEADIAAALGISTGSVKTHTSRALAALSARLENRS